jgi:membrane associated rhomboid family serine protease
MRIGPPLTPPVVQYLIIANLAAFMLQFVSPAFAQFGPVRPFQVWQQGYLWQPFTYMWMHAGLGHILMNMFMLWMFGSNLALVWGPRKFLRFYLLCGIGAGWIIASWPYLVYSLDPQAIGMATVGASGAIYGVLLAYSLTWPDRVIALLFPPIAFRAIWLIPGLFLMTLVFGGGGISHIGHLGGVLMGWLYLRRSGEAGSHLLSLSHLKHRWKRYRMRQKLRAVQLEEWESRRRDDENRRIH